MKGKDLAKGFDAPAVLEKMIKIDKEIPDRTIKIMEMRRFIPGGYGI
jgi:hypothetical protein